MPWRRSAAAACACWPRPGCEAGLVLTLLTVLGLVATPWLTDILAPGFCGPERQRPYTAVHFRLPYTLAAGGGSGYGSCTALACSGCPLFLLPCSILSFCVLQGRLPWACCPRLRLWPWHGGGVAQWLAQWLAVRRLLPLHNAGPADRPGAAPQREQGCNLTLHCRAASLAWNCIGRLPAGLLGASAPQLAMLAAMPWRPPLAGGRWLPLLCRTAA